MPINALPILDSEDFLDDGRIKINSAFSTVSEFVDGLETAVSDLASAGVGVVTSGTWEGDVIEAEYGGTGLSTLVAGSFLYASSTSTVSLRTASQVRNDIGAAQSSTEVIAGDGLSGGGPLSGDVTLSLGTPRCKFGSQRSLFRSNLDFRL